VIKPETLIHPETLMKVGFLKGTAFQAARKLPQNHCGFSR
jgi:hypothetical protein